MLHNKNHQIGGFIRVKKLLRPIWAIFTTNFWVYTEIKNWTTSRWIYH